MIIKNLWRRKIRTLLTTLGIAVGVAAVVALSAFGEGLASGFETMFSSNDADLTIAQKDALMLLISTVDESVGADLKHIPGVDQVAGVVVGVVQMPEAPYFVVFGEEPRNFAIQRYHLLTGQPLAGRREILLGRLTAENFKKSVGETFRFNDATFRVAGIYETGVNFEDGGAVISLDDAQRAFDKRRQVSYFKLKVKNPQDIGSIRDYIEKNWEELIVTRSGEPSKQDEVFDMYRSMGWFMGIFAVLVGGLGMMNSSLMSVFERTREIGLLRALGWKRRRIIGMILGESLLLSLIGGIIGIILGVGLTSLTSLSPSVASMLTGVLTPSIFIQALIIALLLGAIGGFYPAWRAAQFTPIEAMRTESGVEAGWGWFTRLIMRLPISGVFRNLWRRPIRTLMTMIGLGIGSGFVVALIAMTNGMTVAFADLLSGGQADLVAEMANASDASLSVIDERTANQIAARPEVKSISKIIFGVTTTPGLPYFLIYGIDPQERHMAHYRLQEGRAVQRSGEILLGRIAANGLEKKVGERVRIGGSSYTVVGIFENGMAYEDGGGVITLKESQQVFNKPRQISFMNISLHEPGRADEIAQTLETAFPDVIVSKPLGLTERMQDFATMDAIFSMLVLLTIVVGGIVMMNVMMMSVFERTQEIGVLRALGWRKRRVLGMVLTESLALSLLSSAAGVVIGVGLNYLFVLIPGIGGFFTPLYTSDLFVQVLILAVILGAVGGLYPAWRAARLNPIEALRYE